MLSRKSLTHLVRPSAQIFLLSPLRTTSPLPVLVAPCSPSTLSGSLQRSTYATKSKAVPPKRRFKPENKMYKKEVGGFTPETETVLHEFRQACHSPSPAKLMELYPTLRDAKVLTLNDTYHIAHALHFLVRKKRTFDSDKSNLLPFVRQFIDDLKKGALSPTPNAFMHLLTLFRDSRRYNEGYELWKWLADQDDSHVSQGVYGSAIELMAFGGLASLLELEAVYLEGLKRFPGTFAEYHLSPDAIVPDRTRPTYIAGLPMTLLQGILSARILSRDWRNAYLALDTALRLYPTQLPVRYFELFMTERPINEAYTTFLIACRAGIVFKPGHLVNLISKLRSAIVNSSSLHNRIVILRGIANAIYAHLQAGGTLEDTHVSSFIQAFELLLPDKQLQDDNIRDAAELRNMIVVAAHEIMMRLIQAGMSPHASPFVALISLAGKLRVPNLLASTLQDIKTAKLDPGPVGHRNILASAGMLSNTKLIEETWSYISSTAEAEMRQIPYEDWISFVRACRRAHHTEYFEEQYLKFQHAITALIRKRVDAELDTELEARDIKPMKSFTYMEPIAFQLEIEGLKEQFADIQAVVMSGQPLDIGKSPFYMSLDPRRPALSTIENLRAIYDEMTIDPHQPPTQESLEGAAKKANMSSTGLPLDELRFQNWVSILHMMDDAEIYESDYQSEINQAIKEQRRRLEPQVLRMREGHERIPIAMKEELRERIKHLRGSSPQT